MRAASWGSALIAANCLALPVSGSKGDAPAVQTSNAVIASRDGGRLRVMFAAEGQPAVLFKPAGSVWDRSRTGKLVIPVENPGAEPVALLLRVSDGADRTLSGKVSIAPGGAGDLTVWIDAPSPRQMGMIGGPSLAALGSSRTHCR
jgi:hypothetical protein